MAGSYRVKEKATEAPEVFAAWALGTVQMSRPISLRRRQSTLPPPPSETAQLNVAFTRVTSLIDGVAAIATAQIGDLVGPT